MHNKQDRLIDLERKHQSETIPSCDTLETYEEMPIFIPINITEEAIELVARNLSGSSGPGGMDSEALQGWLMKFREDSTRLRTIVETFVGWLANGSLPWEAYRAFMSGLLIELDKQPGLRPVGIGESWQRIFSEIMLKVTVLELPIPGEPGNWIIPLWESGIQFPGTRIIPIRESKIYYKMEPRASGREG